MPPVDTWLYPTPQGLYCAPGDFFIDPTRPVPRAVITHAHSDHARPGNHTVAASPATLALMRARHGPGPAETPLAWGEPLHHRDVTITLHPAGHVLGSAQIVLDHQGTRAVISGDYKRAPDPTCDPFTPIQCDLFITEATFALPIFRHPPAAAEIARLLASVALFPGRTHVIGAYSLGKTQRLIALLRQSGWNEPIYLHGALLPMCAIYQQHGIELGDLRPATVAEKRDLIGRIVLAPPSAIADRWARRLEDPVVCMASGWMRVRQRAKQGGVELPLVISDHADWDELNQTIDDTGAREVWVTHGTEDALIHEISKRGIKGRALRLIGYGEEEAA